MCIILPAFSRHRVHTMPGYEARAEQTPQSVRHLGSIGSAELSDAANHIKFIAQMYYGHSTQTNVIIV